MLCSIAVTRSVGFIGMVMGKSLNLVEWRCKNRLSMDLWCGVNFSSGEDWCSTLEGHSVSVICKGVHFQFFYISNMCKRLSRHILFLQ